MKKSLVSLLVFALVFSLALPAFAASNDLADVEGTEFESAVKTLNSLGVLTGYDDGTFRADNTITRAEFAAVGVRLLGLEGAANAAQGSTQFSDVRDGHWATGYINIGVQQGLLTGYPDGTVEPDAPVTQAEALTILVRALGYAPMAEKVGTWPYNYIVVADQIGLTDDLDVAASSPATRGFVAVASDEALTVPKTVASGFNANGEINYVISGQGENNPLKTLLNDDLGFDLIEDYVVAVDSSDNEITLDGIDETGNVSVSDDFDFAAALGAYFSGYVNDDEEVVFFELGNFLYDAVTVDGTEITLESAGDDYDIDEDALVYIDGEEAEHGRADLADITYGYGKVALNGDGDVRFLEVYEWDGFLVVEEEDDEVVYSYGEELDVEDFTIVKDDKTIASADLAEGDVLFYLEDAAFAEVYNNTVTGDIDRIYTSSFRVDGTTLDFASSALYLDGSTLYGVDADVLESMQEEGEVVAYTDRTGAEAVFVTGELGDVVTSTFVGFLIKESAVYGTRGVTFLALDGVDKNGEEFVFDLGEGVLEDSDYEFDDFDEDNGGTSIEAGSLIEFTVDEDGDVTEFEVLNNHSTTGEADLDSRYVDGQRLLSSTVIFLHDDDDIEEVFAWADAEEYLTDFENATVYASNGNATYIVVDKDDASVEEETTEYDALVTDVRELANGDFETTVVIGGESYTFDLENELTEATAVILAVNAEMDEATYEGAIPGAQTVTGDVYDRDLRNGTLKIDENNDNDPDYTVELVSDGYIFSEADGEEISLRDVEVTDNVTVYFEVEGTERFVKFIVLNE